MRCPPKDNSTTDNDEDDDGIEDAKEGSGSIASYGSAAALRIGSASAISIGATEGTGTGFGLIVDGSILGDGVYAGVDGNGLQIGGMGGTVTIANGIGVSGSIQAKSFDKSGDRRPPGIGHLHARAAQRGQDPGQQRIKPRARLQLRSKSVPGRASRC